MTDKKNVSAKAHYENHLAEIYAWMCGDFETNVAEFEGFLMQNNLSANYDREALDLGAGHGIQTKALFNQGFVVTALDGNKKLLFDLSMNVLSSRILTIHADIVEFLKENTRRFDLILCWGDTLLHLENKTDVNTFFRNAEKCLNKGGKIILSFRNYEHALIGVNRFIPVKNDSDRILTCFLEYSDEFVFVTDLIHLKKGDKWTQKASSYKKLRMGKSEIQQILSDFNFNVLRESSFKGMTAIVAEK